jgi:holo-[acyl-carrier protein] synthase
MLFQVIIGIGVDVVDVAELQDIIDQRGDKYLNRVFSLNEIQYAKAGPDPYQRFAGRLAAKEATMKALRTGWGNDVDWRNVEVVNRDSGEPAIVLHEGAKRRAEALGVASIWVSLSHTHQVAIAEVLLEG